MKDYARPLAPLPSERFVRQPATPNPRSHMEATTSEEAVSRQPSAVSQPPRTDPRASNIVVPFPVPTLLDAPPGVPVELFFERHAVDAVKAIREKINNIAHAVEVWRRYFPGEPFPEKPLAELRAEHERIANLICRANDAVNLEPEFPATAHAAAAMK